MSVAFVCLQCGRRAVVPHGGGFKCRDCGTELPTIPFIIGAASAPCSLCGSGAHGADACPSDPEAPMYRNATAFDAGCYLDCLDYPECPCGASDA